ncbi:MAG: cupin domain-containing protein [Deltaproteobacteria bacterium]|nr:cupin domain-containing protein [Deltaproteobacteria bacterium]
MTETFPKPIRDLPEADIPLEGVKAYLSQSDTHQNSHAAQIGIVLEGRIDLTIGGKTETFTKGNRYFIADNMPHSGKIYAGYADVTFFNEPDRYSKKQRQ